MHRIVRSKRIIPTNQVKPAQLRKIGLLRQEPNNNLIKRNMPLDGNFFDKRMSGIEIDGDKTIVIEFKMKVAGGANDLSFALSYDDGLNTGNLIYIGTTTYTSWGFRLYSGGIFGGISSTSGSMETPGTYYEYRLTINGTSAQAQRGPTLALITHTLNHTMSVSAAGKKFYASFVSGGAPYPGGYFDWIRVYNGGDLIFQDDFLGSSIDSNIWERQSVITYPGDSSVGVGVGSGGGQLATVAINPSSISYASRDFSYNSQMAIFNGTSNVMTDININANCRSMSDTQKWSISFAYRPTGNSGANALIMQSYGGLAGWYAMKSSSEKLVFATANSGGATFKTTTSNESILQNALHHIILEWDGTTLTQYVNLQTVSETKSGSITKTDTLQFGGTGAYGYHAMELGKVKYFNHILSASEKMELHSEIFKLLH